MLFITHLILTQIRSPLLERSTCSLLTAHNQCIRPSKYTLLELSQREPFCLNELSMSFLMILTIPPGNIPGTSLRLSSRQSLSIVVPKASTYTVRRDWLDYTRFQFQGPDPKGIRSGSRLLKRAEVAPPGLAALRET